VCDTISIKVKLGCGVLSDEKIYQAVLDWQFEENGHAARHLRHWRNGGGADLDVDLFKLITENPYIHWQVNDMLWAWDRGHVYGWDNVRYPGAVRAAYPIQQHEFSKSDWQLATGSLNLRIAYPTNADSRWAFLSFTNVYRWHPNEKRKSQCIHQALERLKEKGARDYRMMGATSWELSWPTPRTEADVQAIDAEHKRNREISRKNLVSGGW
jgi:hypothetical protein